MRTSICIIYFPADWSVMLYVSQMTVNYSLGLEVVKHLAQDVIKVILLFLVLLHLFHVLMLNIMSTCMLSDTNFYNKSVTFHLLLCLVMLVLLSNLKQSKVNDLRETSDGTGEDLKNYYGIISHGVYCFPFQLNSM